MKAPLTLLILIALAFAGGYFSANPATPIAFTSPQTSAHAPVQTLVIAHSDFWTGFASGSLITLCAALYAVEKVKRRESRRRLASRV